MPSNESLVGELKKLAELHASGVLNDAEFAEAKGRLLAQSGGDGGRDDVNRAPEDAPRSDADSPTAWTHGPSTEAADWLPPTHPPLQDASERREGVGSETPPPSTTPTSDGVLAATRLQRLRQYEKHQELLCLECGYSGLMGIASPGKAPWYFGWPGFILFFPVIWLLYEISWIVAIVAMVAWVLGSNNSTVATLHCPNCDQLISERK